MSDMINTKIHISSNLIYLRKSKKLSIEEVAEQIGVSRQAVAKWENGETMPDLLKCDALASLYDVALDDLLHFNGEKEEIGIAPKGKYIFGTTVMGERGQIVIPKKARDMLNLKPGDDLIVLGDVNPGTAGLALVPSEPFLGTVKDMMTNFYPKKGGE